MRIAAFALPMSLMLAACASSGSSDDGDGDGCRVRFYEDADGDGQGNPAVEAVGCSPPPGFVTDASDCDDANASTFLGADEICDLRDNDCDSEIDEGLPGIWYLDFDGDNWGSAGQFIQGCDQPDGYVVSQGDCDDNNPDVHPEADETCNGFDDDCDGERDNDPIDGMIAYEDGDGDGFGRDGSSTTLCAIVDGFASIAGDCDDGNPDISPIAHEVCNGFDDDCDALVDDLDDLVDGSAIWYLDSDLDGYGGPVTIEACTQPPGYREAPRDCDDHDASVHPTADEVCDGVDNDCDTLVDDQDALSPGEGRELYIDADGDGAGSGAPILACGVRPGLSESPDDCNDANPDVWPGAVEHRNLVDDDCDGLVDDEDDDVDLTFGSDWFVDADGDGVGGDDVVRSCAAPEGSSDITGDCDDSDASVSDAAIWWQDADGDGYGAGATVVSCAVPGADWVRLGATDCDDGDQDFSPGVVDLCEDGIDQNCNGEDAACHTLLEATSTATDAPTCSWARAS
jgi:hypothetical protein